MTLLSNDFVLVFRYLFSLSFRIKSYSSTRTMNFRPCKQIWCDLTKIPDDKKYMKSHLHSQNIFSFAMLWNKMSPFTVVHFWYHFVLIECIPHKSMNKKMNFVKITSKLNKHSTKTHNFYPKVSFAVFSFFSSTNQINWTPNRRLSEWKRTNQTKKTICCRFHDWRECYARQWNCIVSRAASAMYIYKQQIRLREISNPFCVLSGRYASIPCYNTKQKIRNNNSR